MLSKGQGRTMGSYFTLLNALAEDGRLEEAEELWLKLFSQNLESMPRIFFQKMIAIYYQREMNEKMFEVSFIFYAFPFSSFCTRSLQFITLVLLFYVLGIEPFLSHMIHESSGIKHESYHLPLSFYCQLEHASLMLKDVSFVKWFLSVVMEQPNYMLQDFGN